ncbi:MAG: hypothetical protein RL748_2356, partial [Pseudomonadota bacterium]
PPRPEPVKGGRLPVATLAPSAKIIEFLKGQEAYVLEPYHDSKTLCTIGFGHLIDGEFSCPDLRAAGNAKILEFDKGITLEKAEALMVEDLKRTEKTLQRQIKVPLYQCEYDALFSLIYNCGGIAHFPKLYTAITNAKYDECVTHFADITKGGKGLPERRQAEMEIFRHAVYKMKPIVRVKKPKV